VSQKNLEVVDDERGTSRLEAFSDGVIAVAITLLVLDIHVPTQGDLANSDLLYWLFTKQWPYLLGYVTSFLLIGIYWANHHQMFKYIKRTDHFFLMINIVFLMSIVFIPFTTSLITGAMARSDVGYKHEAALIYSASLLLAGLTYNAIWWYSAHKHRLLATNLSPHFVRRLRWSYLTGVPLYLLSMLLSLVSVEASIALYILIAVIYVLPLDRLRARKESNDTTKGDIQNISELQEEHA
jgi:uncharacterized membrane protein